MLVAQAVGYAADAGITGGIAGPTVHVTNLNNSGSGSLRSYLEADGPMWIVFDVSGTIDLASVIHVESDKTIDGRGANITIANYGLVLGEWNFAGFPASNLIVHNVTFADCIGNAMMLIAENASTVWIDHCTFGNRVDESIFIGSEHIGHTTPPFGVTVSWCKFIAGGAGHCVLVSNHGLTQDEDCTITLHHNYYTLTEVRHPLLFYAKIHAFNNFYDRPIVTVDVLTDGQFLSENDIFKLHGGGKVKMVDPWIVPPEGFGSAANCKVSGALLLDGATVEELNASGVFTPPYAYTLDVADSSLQTAVSTGAGRQ